MSRSKVGVQHKSDADTTLAATQRGYLANRDLVAYVQNDATANPPEMVSKYQYRNDATSRRRDVVYTGAAFDQDHMFKWGYNTRSELETADRHEGTTPDNPGDLMMLGDHDYRYDNIGNRTSYRLDVDPATTYAPNNLNQYTSTANPTENFCYDADGNLTQDGRSVANCSEVEGMFSYYWDAENRLIRVERTTPDLPTDKRVVYTYDHLGRRVRKVVYGLDDKTFEWLSEPESDLRFVYDGWNVVEVLDGLASNRVVKKYTWGLDLSGLSGNSTVAGIQGAGGIGGLLAAVEAGTTGSPAYWFFYDANGNVGQAIKASDSSIAAQYEYDPYGNAIVATGSYVAANPIRFSTKWFDAETGMYYYIYRYYSPRLGRWMSRDPIGEEGSTNLAEFVLNRPTVLIDVLGHRIKVLIWGEMGVDMSDVEGDNPGSNVSITWRPPVNYSAYSTCPCTKVMMSQIARTIVERVGRDESPELNAWHLDPGPGLWYPHQTPWLSTSPLRAADLSDDPQVEFPFSLQRLHQEFVTVAVCVKGREKGTVYGAVAWGHEIKWVHNDKASPDNMIARWASHAGGSANTGWVRYDTKPRALLPDGPGWGPTEWWKILVNSRWNF